jgi:hypothetical protein
VPRAKPPLLIGGIASTRRGEGECNGVKRRGAFNQLLEGVGKIGCEGRGRSTSRAPEHDLRRSLDGNRRSPREFGHAPGALTD